MEPRASAEPVRASSRLFSAQRLLRIAPRCSSECARVRARVQAAPLALRLTRARVSPARPGAAAGGCVAGCRRGREASRRARTRCLSALRRALCSRLALCKLCHAFPALPDASPGAQASRQHACLRSAARHQAPTQSASTTACGCSCRAATTRRPPRRGRARPACRAWMTWRWTSGCCGAAPSPPRPWLSWRQAAWAAARATCAPSACASTAPQQLRQPQQPQRTAPVVVHRRLGIGRTKLAAHRHASAGAGGAVRAPMQRRWPRGGAT
jgi:hypothetical protein